MRVKAWIEREKIIACMSMLCDLSTNKCERYDLCKWYEIKIKEIKEIKEIKKEGD